MPDPPIRSNEPKMCRQPSNRSQRNEFEALVTPEEAGSYLRIHPKTVVRLARQKLLPALRIGKHWRFRASDLIDWTEGRLQSSSQPVE
jgi:excisionase family DNA binding protein